MTRAASQLTTFRQPQHIFMTDVIQFDGTKRGMISSQPLGDQSIRMNRAGYSGALFLLMIAYAHNNILYYSSATNKHETQLLCIDVWKNIFGFIFGLSQDDNDSVTSLGYYAVAIRRPASIFQNIIRRDPFFVVDAVMRGQEDMVMNVLRADPSYLLEKATIKNSICVTYTVTPLQAAIMANDIQMVEKMQEHFARLTTDLKGNPIDGLAEMHKQIKTIYMQSLNCYKAIQQTVLKEQEAKQTQLLELANLNEAQKKQHKKIIEEKIKQATARIVIYSAALEQSDIHKIIEAHNQAQEHNVFNFQPYVDAICNASDVELDDVMALILTKTPEAKQAAIAKGVSPIEIGFAKNDQTVTREEVQALPFSELTLLQKLNRFREKSVNHKKQEIIFNPNHVLTGLRHNKETWDAVDAKHIADPEYKKRSVIFSQLVGWEQRNASEPVKQDIRQGTAHLIEENEVRSRPSCFNSIDSDYRLVRNSLGDVSSLNASYVDGLGYKFAGSGWAAGRTPGDGLRPPTSLSAGFFHRLCQEKNRKFAELATPRV